MKKAFTLIELMIVVAIIGMLVTMAVPQYSRIVERSRQTEGINVLQVISASNSRYYLQYGSYANNPDLLDIPVPTLLYFINPPTWSISPTASLVKLIRNPASPGGSQWSYTLESDASGAIWCQQLNPTCTNCPGGLPCAP